MNRRADVPMQDFIFIRVLTDEKAAIQDAAKRQGVTVSEFSRQAMSDAAQKAAA